MEEHIPEVLQEAIAPANTILGLLQRGRGEGYRQILAVPQSESHALLTRCITQDPRLDHQIESRDTFYASIAVDIGLPLEPLAEHLRKQDDESQGSWQTTLTVTTLTELAKRNYKDAIAILYDYVKWGQWWNWPLDDLLSLPGKDLAPHLADAVEEHFPDDDSLDEAMQGWPPEQFAKLSQFSPRIKASVDKALIDSPRAEADLPNLETLSSEGLLALANQTNCRILGKAIAKIVSPADTDLLVSHVSLEKPFVTHVALAGLTQLAPASILGLLTDLWLNLPEGKDPRSKMSWVILRQAIARAILALPPAVTLPLARTWIAQQNERKQDIAEKLLQEHATPEDIALLRDALMPLLLDEEEEWGCYMIRAFYNLPNVGIIPELVDIFYQFRFSKGRAYAAQAIQITSPEYFAENLAFECLWDCEEETRELGAKFANLNSPDARRRIQQLANDALEEASVRDAAIERLKDA